MVLPGSPALATCPFSPIPRRGQSLKAGSAPTNFPITTPRDRLGQECHWIQLTPHTPQRPMIYTPSELQPGRYEQTRLRGIFRSAHLRQVLTGRPPFSDTMTKIAAMHAMLNGDRPSRRNDHEISDRVWYMIQRCWHSVPSRRMSVREAVDLLEIELTQQA